jgi:isocitrate dehydrogenase (NAD+)
MNIAVIGGDGTGPEVAAEGVKVLKAVAKLEGFDKDLKLTDLDWGGDRYLKTGEALPADAIDQLRKFDCILLGAVGHPDVKPGILERKLLLDLRFGLDQYINLRPVKLFPGVECPIKGKNPEDIDFVVVRENTEDLYSGLEHEVVPGVVESLKIITERASTRIAEFAFTHARTNGRKRVTAIHKANIMKLGDGLFLNCTRKVSRSHTDLTYDERIVDAVCMQLVMFPERFDVLLLPNLYGDIVSDLCAGLVGGLGVVPGANIGVDSAIFEAVHGSAPDIANKNMANPTALLLSALMMLDYIGETAHRQRIRDALGRVLTRGEVRTRDMGGTASTTEFADAICRELEK